MEEIPTNQSYDDNDKIEYNVSEERPSMSQNPQLQDEKLQKNPMPSPNSPESTGQDTCVKNRDNIGYTLGANPPDVEGSVEKCHFGCETGNVMSHPCQNAYESNPTQQWEDTHSNSKSDVYSNDCLLPPATAFSLPPLPSQLPLVLTSVESPNHSWDVSYPHYAEMCEMRPGDTTHDVHVDIISVPTTISTLLPSQFKKSSNLELTNVKASSVKLEDEASLTASSPIIKPPAESENPDLVPRYSSDMLDKVKGMRTFYKIGPCVTAECKICLEEKVLNLRLCCKAAVCDTCMTTYLEGVIQEGKVKIFCPGFCPETYIPRQEIAGRISPEMKDKFYKFLVDANNEPHIKTCPHCSHVLEVELAKIQKRSVKKKGYPVTCALCQLHWCFPCQSPWHEGITCKDFRKGDKLLKKWAKEKFMGQLNAKKCPKCQVFIQRINGCDKMVCRRCKTSFCYKCGWRWIGGYKCRFCSLGCEYIYELENDALRRLIIFSLFGAMLIMALVLVLLAPFLFIGYYLLFRPIKKLVKQWEYEKRAMEYARWKANEYCHWKEYVRSMKFDEGDPYIKEFNHMQHLRVSACRLAEVVDVTAGSQGRRHPSTEDEEEMQSPKKGRDVKNPGFVRQHNPKHITEV